MSFVFRSSIRDVIRDRNLSQRLNDKLKNKPRGKNASGEDPSLTIHGITPNGTYFLCTLVYKTQLSERKRMSLFALIDAYANTQDRMQRIQLKSRITKACGDQIEGMAFLFSKSNQSYGFVSGKRICIARVGDVEPYKLEDDELFFAQDRQLCQFRTFILKNDNVDPTHSVREFLQSDEDDDVIDTNIINAIKYVRTLDRSSEDMQAYLNAISSAIQQTDLGRNLQLLNDLLASNAHRINHEMRDKINLLTVQLLCSKNQTERQQLLIEYASIASQLYGSKRPSQMIVGIGLFLIGIGVLLSSIAASASIIPPLLMILMSFVPIILGYFEYYNTEAQIKRNMANSLFLFKEKLAPLPSNVSIPEKIIDTNPMRI